MTALRSMSDWLSTAAHVQREFLLAFECDSHFLVYLAGLPSFVLFVVETFFYFVNSRVWSLLLAVFAFVFYPAFGFGQLASST